MKSSKILLTLVSASLTGLAMAAPKGSKPNIVFLLMDDMGYGDLSCMGSTKISTPNIDALAKSGKMLTQHYSGAPVSAPSRCVLLTGKHTGHSVIRGNDEWSSRGAVWSLEGILKDANLEGQRPMPATTRTMAHELQDAGYVTACIGKWGLGAPGSASEPNRMGFDFFYGYNCQRVSHTYYPTHLYKNTEREIINPVLEMNITIDTTRVDLLDARSYDRFHTGTYAPDLMFAETLKFIEQNKQKPFFLWWTTPIPHVSLQAPAVWVERYRRIFGDEKPFLGNHYYPTRYPHASYAALVSYVDDQIGQIVQKLKDEGIYDNTIIVFTSDNGPSCEGGGDSPWFDSGRPFRSEEGWGKRSLQEGGLRVPTIVSWQGHIKPSTSDAMISGFQDWLPTLLEFAGVESSTSGDGLSLTSVLMDNGGQKQHDFLYWEYPDGGGAIAVRRGDWKMIVKRVIKNPTYYLYNIATDPREQTNLADKYPQKIEEMKALAAVAHAEPENVVFKMNLPLK